MADSAVGDFFNKKKKGKKGKGKGKKKKSFSFSAQQQKATQKAESEATVSEGAPAARPKAPTKDSNWVEIQEEKYTPMTAAKSTQLADIEAEKSSATEEAENDQIEESRQAFQWALKNSKRQGKKQAKLREQEANAAPKLVGWRERERMKRMAQSVNIEHQLTSRTHFPSLGGGPAPPDGAQPEAAAAVSVGNVWSALGAEEDSEEELEVAYCPNRSNNYHECTRFCLTYWLPEAMAQRKLAAAALEESIVWEPFSGEERDIGQDEWKSKARSLLREYIEIKDDEEAEKCMQELGCPSRHPQLVTLAVELAMESLSWQAAADSIGQLCVFLRTCRPRMLTREQLKEGLSDVEAALSDLALDYPNAPRVFAAIKTICAPTIDPPAPAAAADDVDDAAAPAPAEAGASTDAAATAPAAEAAPAPAAAATGLKRAQELAAAKVGAGGSDATPTPAPAADSGAAATPAPAAAAAAEEPAAAAAEPAKEAAAPVALDPRFAGMKKKKKKKKKSKK